MMFDPRAVARARRRATRGPNVASAVRLRRTSAIKDYLRPTPPPEQQTAAPGWGPRRVVGVALAPPERLEKRSPDAAGSKTRHRGLYHKLKDQPP